LRCDKHSDVETSLTCGRCETPVCVRCMVHTDVGIRCGNCAPRRSAVMALGSTRFRNVIIIVGLLFAAVLLIGGGSRLGGGSSRPPDYSEYVDEFMEASQLEVTVTQMVDPWPPDSAASQPRAGRRLVAMEVTIANTASGQYPHYVTSSLFKLIDTEGFAYGTAGSLHEPALGEGLALAPGEKTRGWVTFEIDEISEIKSISYAGAKVALPGA
jgi:Domain of unknown function (DUF4352)